MDIKVTHNTESNQFESLIDGCLSIIEYRLQDDVITLYHTEVPKALGGMGVASRMAKYALDYAESQGLKVVPECPFIKSYIEKHSEYQSLLAD